MHLTGGWSVTVDDVVLALGNPPPRRLMQYAAHAGYLPDPWAPDLAEQVGEPAEVLLVGSGLTALDVVSVLHDTTPMSRFTLVSRHGLLPRTHRRDPSPMRQTVDVPAGPLDSLVAQVRALVDTTVADGEDWRDVVDTLRASANRLWRALDEEEQAGFARDHGRAWEVARHRMPPHQADVRASAHVGRAARRTHPGRGGPGRLRRGRQLQRTGPGHHPRLEPARRHAARPRHDPTAPARSGHRPRPDRAGRRQPPARRCPTSSRSGPARRGLDWEVTAVPDLRSQALEVAEEILPALAGRGGRTVTA